MLDAGWQDETLARIVALTERDTDVAALVLFGSLAGPPEAIDRWSDIDVIVVTRPGARGGYFPATEWLSTIGTIWAASVVEKAHTGVILACFEDGRRVDAVVLDEPAAGDDVGSWEDNPFRAPSRALFSRSPVVDALIALAAVMPLPHEADEIVRERSDAFWFNAGYALRRIVRGDLLIGTHLVLEMVRECLVLEMVLRDAAAGTRHHRAGAATDDAALAEASTLMGAWTREGLLDTMERAAHRFDALAGRASGVYRARAGPLLSLIDEARGET